MSEHYDYDGITYKEETASPIVFRALFIVLAVWGVGFMAYYLFGGWSSQTEAEAARTAREARKQASLNASQSTGSGNNVEGSVASYAARGKQLFDANCTACHGEKGKGGVGPDLTQSKYKYGKSRTEIVQSVEQGRPEGMPGFNGQLNHEQIESLVEYVLSLK